jgi:hypothetical protein
MSYQFDPAQFDRREELIGDRRRAPLRRLLAVAAVLLVIGVFAAGLRAAYVAGTRHAAVGGASEVPLIRADARPMMVRPAEPGGLKIPDRNMLIYDPGKPMVEHLLPPPEQPMLRPTVALAGAEAAAPAMSLPPTAASAGAPAMSAPAVSLPTSAAAPMLPATPHGTLPAKTGYVRLQLGSVRSAGAARLEWDRIRQRNADLLGALSANPVRADLGDKGVYYRIETGPIGDLAANRICGALKARKVGCVIVR